jgi:homopolymeric O-antigen transport system permease protein
MIRKISQLFTRKELIQNLVVRTLKVRYKNSALGFLWSLLNPLLMMVIYCFFIGILDRFETDMVPKLIIGVIFWQFVVMCSSDAVNAIAGYPNLIKKTYFPRLVLPFSMVIANLINYLLSLIVLMLILVLLSISPTIGLDFSGIWLLIPTIILQTLLVLGIALAVSAGNVFFRDIEHVIGTALMAMFFITPILYPLEKARDNMNSFFYNLYLMNPFASLVTLMRYCFLGVKIPLNEPGFYISLLLSPAILIIGLIIFTRVEPYFADEL